MENFPPDSNYLPSGGAGFGFLNVVYVSDSRYWPHTSASMVSLAQSSRDLLGTVYAVLVDVPARKKKRIISWGRGLFEQNFQVIPVSSTSLPALNTKGHVSKAAYVRAFLGDVLPVSLGHVLYLDSDTLVVRPLSGLRSVVDEIQGFGHRKTATVFAVANPEAGDHLRAFGVPRENYFNSGVMLIDLMRWRDRNPANDLLRLFTEHNVWWDQDGFNLFFQGDWAPLPSEFNRFEISEATEEEVIVHFAGSQKPWDFQSHHPYRSDYLRARAEAGSRLIVPSRLLRGFLLTAFQWIVQAWRRLT